MAKLSTEEIKQIAKDWGSDIRGFYIFRVVNNHDRAYVGAGRKALVPIGSSMYYLLEIDTDREIVTSEERFNPTGKLSWGKTKAKLNEKLDKYEGKRVSRPSDKGSGIIDGVKKAKDINEGTWFSSPECPSCGSQKVGKEKTNVFQCRECGTVIKTGENINFE